MANRGAWSPQYRINQITGLAVQQHSTLVHQILVEVILIKYVRKPIARSECSIGQFLFSQRLDQTMNFVQPVETFLKPSSSISSRPASTTEVNSSP